MVCYFRKLSGARRKIQFRFSRIQELNSQMISLGALKIFIK